MATLGFIGTGNMGGALARAACKSIPSDQVFLANRSEEKAMHPNLQTCIDPIE